MLINEKVRPALQCQTDRRKITLANSIAYSNEIIPVVKRPIGLDSFIGNTRSFKLYLKAQRVFLETGVLVP